MYRYTRILLAGTVLLCQAMLACEAEPIYSRPDDENQPGPEDAGRNGDNGSDADTDTDTDTDADGDAGADLDTDADSDADTDADADTDTDVIPDAGPQEPAYYALFASDHLPVFELTIPPASWTALGTNPEIYQPGSFRYRKSANAAEDVVIANIGIRLKGRASMRTLDEKAAFKIKFNEFVPGQRFLGLRRLTLNNMVQDPSMVRERLGYMVFREAGVAAPLCNHAKVYVNGTYYGLYANVQSLDQTFLDEHFVNPNGNLYDISNDEYFIDFVPEDEHLFILETNTDAPDTSDLTHVITELNRTTVDFVTRAESVIDLNQFIRVGAVQAMISDWDGYFGADNNFKTYHDLVSDRFVIFPWGIDQTFGIQDGTFNKLNYKIDHSTSGRTNGMVWTNCKNHSVCRPRYNTAVAEVLAIWNTLPLETVLDQILAQTTDAIYADTRKEFTNTQFDSAVTQVRSFLQQRGGIVDAQLP